MEDSRWSFRSLVDINAPPIESPHTLNTEFPMAFEEYSVGRKIGQGASAVVYLATYGQVEVALKLIELDLFERNQIDELRREIQVTCCLTQAYCLLNSGITLFDSGASSF